MNSSIRESRGGQLRRVAQHRDAIQDGDAPGDDAHSFLRLREELVVIARIRGEYANRCAIRALRERTLVQAAHIVRDIEPEGIAAVVNGIAMCAIHHLAYDRNVLGIDPQGRVHIADRILREHDGPMLRAGLQGFHGADITLPRRPVDRPDPQRLAVRFEEFAAGRLTGPAKVDLGLRDASAPRSRAGQ